MSNTNAVEVNIQAVAPVSMGGVSAAKRSDGIIEISDNKKAGRSTVFITRFSRFSISQFLRYHSYKQHERHFPDQASLR